MRVEEFISWEVMQDNLKNKGKFVIRPSAIQQFINCPAQWFRANIVEDFRKPAAAAEAGTALHKGAEIGYTEKIKTGKLPPVSVLTDAVVEEWKTLNEKEVEYSNGDDYHSYESDIVKGITEYRNLVMEDVNPTAVETRYTIKIDSPVIESVSGTIDIDLENGLADIKMTNKKPVLNKYTLQQSTYALLKERSGKSCEFCEIHNVQRGKSAERLALGVEKEYARTWINTILDTVESFAETKNVNLFRGSNPTSNFLCSESWCGYWNKCPFVKGLRR